jgi:hypothetical protein
MTTMPTAAPEGTFFFFNHKIGCTQMMLMNKAIKNGIDDGLSIHDASKNDDDGSKNKGWVYIFHFFYFYCRPKVPVEE